MRPFYRKDLFRDNIITSMPIGYEVKIDLEHMKLEVLKMEKGQSVTLNSDEYEVGMVVLSGTAAVEMDDFMAEDLGERKDVFSGKPTAVYVPAHTQFKVTATGYGVLEVVICKAKGTEKIQKPFVIKPNEINHTEKGVFNWKREVNEIFVDQDENQKNTGLIITETYGCPGQWATYPYEEDQKQAVFYFKVDPNNSKKVQVMRDAEDRMKYYINNDRAVLVQNPYLPVPEVEGCKIYYLSFKLK